jgi:integrase
VRGAPWGEIDHKARRVDRAGDPDGKEHRVPLSGPALAILHDVDQLRDRSSGALVFPGAKEGKPLSDMALTAPA